MGNSKAQDQLEDLRLVVAKHASSESLCGCQASSSRSIGLNKTAMLRGRTLQTFGSAPLLDGLIVSSSPSRGTSSMD